MRGEILELLQDSRLVAEQQRALLKSLSPQTDFRPLQPASDWRRGAAFRGHRQAISREVKAYEAAAAAQRREADRLREKISNVATGSKGLLKKGKRVLSSQLAALRDVLAKTSADADLYDRQALAAKRFLHHEGPMVAASLSQREPSPIDSLAAAMAESSLEGPSQLHVSQVSVDDPAGTVSDRRRPYPLVDTTTPSLVDLHREPVQTPHSVQPQRPLVTDALGAPMARSTDSPSPTLVRQTGQIHTPPAPRHSARQNARPPRAKAKG